jgi:hypothetical protein
MKKAFLLISILSFQILFGQSRKITGIILNAPKTESISVCISENSKTAELKTCVPAKTDGSFEIIPSDNLKKPYKLTFIITGKEKKEYLVYDTTKLPLRIVMSNPQSVYDKLDRPKYDPAVKLMKFEHGESGGDENASNQKSFKRSGSEPQQITITYNEACGSRFKPAVKFASDTLYVELNKVKAETPADQCQCESTLHVSGLKTKTYKVVLNGEAISEKQ